MQVGAASISCIPSGVSVTANLHNEYLLFEDFRVVCKGHDPVSSSKVIFNLYKSSLH